MNKNPQIYHGEWWVPAVADHNTRMITFQPEKMMGHEKRYTGTLKYYGDADTTLELYRVPSNFHSRHYYENHVMWGKDANGHIFTLFNVLMKEHQMGDFTCTKFVVSLILVCEHVLSIEDSRFKSCEVHFPYLRNWAFHDSITPGDAGDSVYFKTPYTATNLLETINNDGACWRLWQGQTIERTIYDLTIIQIATLEIEAVKALSIRSYLKQIDEFA